MCLAYQHFYGNWQPNEQHFKKVYYMQLKPFTTVSRVLLPLAKSKTKQMILMSTVLLSLSGAPLIYNTHRGQCCCSSDGQGHSTGSGKLSLVRLYSAKERNLRKCWKWVGERKAEVKGWRRRRRQINWARDNGVKTCVVSVQNAPVELKMGPGAAAP